LLLPLVDALRTDRDGPRILATAAAVPQADDAFASEALMSLFALFMGSTIAIPPLRQRLADLPELVHQLSRAQDERARWSNEAMDALLRCDWPGNVRELKSAVVRTLAARCGLIRRCDLPLDIRQQIGRTRLTMVKRAERDAIMAALEASHGNKVIAADELGISRSSLYRKIEQYGLTGASRIVP
jgi:transcriptional regulator of acetoin/glycerol metabolism